MAPLPDGGIRLSSGAFQNSTGTDGMSVDLADTLEREGKNVESTINEHPGFGLVRLTAGFCMAEEQVVLRAPEDRNPAHGEVIGKKAHGRRKRFANAATWVIRPAKS